MFGEGRLSFKGGGGGGIYLEVACLVRGSVCWSGRSMFGEGRT